MRRARRFYQIRLVEKGILETIERSLALLENRLSRRSLNCIAATAKFCGRATASKACSARRKKATRAISVIRATAKKRKLAIEMDVFDAFQTSVNIVDQTPIDGNVKLAAEKGFGNHRQTSDCECRFGGIRKSPPIRIITNTGNRIEKLKFDFLSKST
jgi:hypothetical protein